MMILTCSSPLIAAKVTIAWITFGFNIVFVRPRHRRKFLASVESLLINMPVLILDGVEFAPLALASSLKQGCPASCMLYIIGVDPYYLPYSRLLTFQVFRVLLTTGPWAAMACLPYLTFRVSSTILSRRLDNKSIVANLHSSVPDNYLMMKGPLVSQFGTVISASHLRNACLVCLSASMCPFTINTTMQFTSLISHFLFLVMSNCLCPLQCVCSW